MAQSPSHKWGQIIGLFLEDVLRPKLNAFAKKHGLFLDVKGPRKARERRKKVTWIDIYGNTHDLDFVLERNGNEDNFGEPTAFIESAWRRYTKHSRNKAQEIQGAILPLLAMHYQSAPFIGVILAGDFTTGSLTQMSSVGFNVLYFSYSLIVKTFTKFGLDASSEENTPAQDFEEKIKAWKKFTDKDKLAQHLLHVNRKEVNRFFNKLEKAVSRYITSISITPLHGASSTLRSVGKAIEFIKNHKRINGKLPVLKYEIVIKYNNGDKVEGTFKDNKSAIEFLGSYKAPRPKKK